MPLFPGLPVDNLEKESFHVSLTDVGIGSFLQLLLPLQGCRLQTESLPLDCLCAKCIIGVSLLLHTALYGFSNSDLVMLPLHVFMDLFMDNISNIATEWDIPATFLSLQMVKLQPCLEQRDMSTSIFLLN